jgi:succinoglycan biosynthesis transport protein ExoP
MSDNRHILRLDPSDHPRRQRVVPERAFHEADMRADVLSAAPGSGVFSIGDIFRSLRRRIWIVAITTLCVAGLVALIVFQLTPKYDAQAMLVLEARNAQVANVQDVMPGLPMDNPAMHTAVIRSELDILTSRTLARQVIEDLGLATEPEFNPALRTGPSWLGRLFFWMDEADQMQAEARVQTLLDSLRSTDSEEGPDPDPILAVIDAYLANLTVKSDGRSLTFLLTFRSENPELAARIANRHAQLYLASHVALKAEATTKANAWLTQRVEELRQQVAEAERAVQAYRVEHKLNRMPGVDAPSMFGQQLAEMSAQLVTARAERAQAEARLSQAQELARSRTSMESVPEVLASATIQRLREQEARLVGMEMEIAERYRDNHPPLLNVRAQLRGVRKQIDAEMRNIVRSLSNNVAIARSREKALEANVEQLRANLSNVNMAEVKLWQLEREADARRELLQTFMARLQETSSGSPSERPDARIISAADAPLHPAFPRKKLFLAAGIAFGLITGAGIALLVDRMDSRVRSSDEVEILTSVPTLGLVPAVTSSWRRKATAANAVIEDPMSNYAEAIRSVRSALSFSDTQKPPVSVVITSALPQEGKTTLAASLARSSALSGRKTILVDCDLRRPGVAALLRRPTFTNIGDVLHGRLQLEEVIHRDEVSGLDFIPAPSNVWNSLDLLSSPRMADLVAQLSRLYERVYIDTPPVLAVSDALAVGQYADAMLFAVRWGTPDHVISEATRRVRTASLVITGTVVTHVDLRRHTRFGYKDVGYYYGKYQSRSA